MFPIITKIPVFPILGLVFGILLLLFGRRLFWLFVGAVGFLFGLSLATRFFSAQPEWVTLALALICGLAGALLAVFVKRIAIAVAGFAVGGYIIYQIMAMVQANLGELTWVIYIVGGILGAIIFALLFDWTLIILSSITGAIMTTQAIPIPLPGALEIILAVVLVIVGLVFQANMKKNHH